MVKKFSSKIDRGISLCIGLILTLLTTVFLLQSIWLVTCGMILLDIFVAYTFFTTAYVITADTLIVKCGFYRRRIPIQSIRKITRIKSILNAPANSFTRLEIFYNTFDSIMISPKHEHEFITLVTNHNPHIDVDLPPNSVS